MAGRFVVKEFIGVGLSNLSVGVFDVWGQRLAASIDPVIHLALCVVTIYSFVERQTLYTASRLTGP